MTKKTTHTKKQDSASQLKISKEFEEHLYVEVNPWAKSCKKIKGVLEDFFKKS